MSDNPEDLHNERLNELEEYDRNAVFRFVLWIAAGFLLSAIVWLFSGSAKAGFGVFGLVVLVAIASGD